VVDPFLEWVAGLPPAAIYAVLVALSAVENVFPPVPADVAVVLGAFLAREGHLSVVVLGVLCWLGNTGSAAAMYFYARAHGRRFFNSGWPRRFMPPEAIAVLEEAYARHGVYGIFLSRFLPGVRAAVTPFAGVVGMPALRALIPAAGASAIWYTFLVAAGTLLAQSWPRARALVEDANRALAVVALLAVVLLLAWVRRRMRHHRARG
jgi:membrane protein DedA with SNARE-associated domain